MSKLIVLRTKGMIIRRVCMESINIHDLVVVMHELLLKCVKLIFDICIPLIIRLSDVARKLSAFVNTE